MFYIFSWCNSLTSITSYIKNPSDIDYYTFDWTYETATLYVPQGSIGQYQSCKGWKNFDHIETIHPALSLVEPLVVNAGEEKDVRVLLSNPYSDVEGIKFDIVLSDGLSLLVDESDMCDRTTLRHFDLSVTLSGVLKVDGKSQKTYYVNLSSFDGTLISGTEGAIVKLRIKANNDFKGGELVMNNTACLYDGNWMQWDTDYHYILPFTRAFLAIEPFSIATGEEAVMTVDLTNPEDELSEVSFLLHLPEGLSIKESGSKLDFDMCDRTEWRKHKMTVSETEDGYACRLFSNSSTAIDGMQGGIMKMTLVADEHYTGGKVVMDNIRLITPDGQNLTGADHEYLPTAIAPIAAKNNNQPVRIYNMNGQPLDALQKGVNIIRYPNGQTKKVLVK